MRYLLVIIVALVLGLAACGGDDEPGPEEALIAYSEARTAGDIDAMLAVFSPDVVIAGHPFNPMQAIDLEQFESLERNVVAAFQVSTEVSNIEVDGNTATFSTTFTNVDGECYFSTDHEVTVEDGKITELVLHQNPNNPPNC